jgi:hypothetical protein
MFLIFLISSSRDAGPVLKPEMQAFFLLAYFIIPAFAFQWNGADRMEKCRKENEGRKEEAGHWVQDRPSGEFVRQMPAYQNI